MYIFAGGILSRMSERERSEFPDVERKKVDAAAVKRLEDKHATREIIHVIGTQTRIEALQKICTEMARARTHPIYEQQILAALEERLFKLFTELVEHAKMSEAEALRDKFFQFKYADPEMQERVEKRITDYLFGKYTA